MRWCATVLLLASALLGCGGDEVRPHMRVSAYADWPFLPEAPEALGYELTVNVSEFHFGGGSCRTPPDARLTINDEEARLTRDPASGCLDVEFVKGPLLDWRDDPVIVRYEEGPRTIAEAIFHKLAPGANATLIMPSGETARAGEAMLIVPPRELPTSNPPGVHFFPLDAEATATWDPRGVLATSTRLPDGIHATVPQLAGRAVVVLRGTPEGLKPEYSCDGFYSCDGGASSMMGPFFLTVQP